jgi:hypothetical protein
VIDGPAGDPVASDPAGKPTALIPPDPVNAIISIYCPDVISIR